MTLKAIDLFSGIGGLSLGFDNAGIDVKAAFEYWDNAIDIYNDNFKKIDMDHIEKLCKYFECTVDKLIILEQKK